MPHPHSHCWPLILRRAVSWRCDESRYSNSLIAQYLPVCEDAGSYVDGWPTFTVLVAQGAIFPGLPRRRDVAWIRHKKPRIHADSPYILTPGDTMQGGFEASLYQSNAHGSGNILSFGTYYALLHMGRCAYPFWGYMGGDWSALMNGPYGCRERGPACPLNTD